MTWSKLIINYHVICISVRTGKGTSEYSDPPSFSSSKEIDQAVHAGCQREVGNVRNQRGVGNGQNQRGVGNVKNQRGVGNVQNPVDFGMY